jgi:hypothetical protein
LIPIRIWQNDADPSGFGSTTLEKIFKQNVNSYECQAPLLPKNGSGWRLPASLLSSCPEPPAPFGIMFDIDGVIVRGRKVLPFAPEERIMGSVHLNFKFKKVEYMVYCCRLEPDISDYRYGTVLVSVQNT